MMIESAGIRFRDYADDVGMCLTGRDEVIQVKTQCIGKNFVILFHVFGRIAAVHCEIERRKNSLTHTAEACRERVRYILIKGSQVFKTALFYCIECH